MLVMQTALIVAMTMQEAKVRKIVPSARRAGEKMIDVQAILIGQEPSAAGASAALEPEQEGNPRRHQGVGAQSLGPIHEIPVEGAGGPFHLHVEADGHLRVTGKDLPIGSGEAPGGAASGRPVLALEPGAAFVRMAKACLTPEQPEEVMVARAEGARGGHRAVLHRPAFDDRVERRDQVPLRGCTVHPDDSPHLRLVPGDGRFARSDAQLEGEQVAVRVFPDLGAASGMLAYREAEEVEPHMAIDGMERVGHTGLAGLQGEPSGAEPFLDDGPRSLDPFTGGVQDHEVIGVASDQRSVVTSEGRVGGLFQPVEGDIREQGRDDRVPTTWVLAGFPVRSVANSPRRAPRP